MRAVDNGQVSDERSTEAAEESDERVDATEEPPPRRRGVLFAIAGLVFLADLLTKIIAVAALEGREPVRLLGGFVYLQLVRNPGAAFGMATGMTWLLTLIAVSVVVAILWILPKLRSLGWAIGLGLVLAGALGNLVDRFFRAPGPLRGHVVDFVSVFAPNGEVWPVFNVADSAIVLGGAVIVLMAVLGRDYDGRVARRETKQRATAEEDPGQ